MLCNNCGAPIAPDQSYCPNCGTKIVRVQTQTAPEFKENNDFYIDESGEVRRKESFPEYERRQPVYETRDIYERRHLVSDKSRLVALLFWVFLGVVGGHQFYAGRIGKGILYFFTGGLFGIGLIIDLVQILTGNFKDKYGLPMKLWE